MDKRIPKFKNNKLFEKVFTHRSFLNESIGETQSNERLEFLGDAILSFVVSTHLFKKHRLSKEGELTNLRSILTNTESLYIVGKELKLGEKLRLSKGEEANMGRKNKTILANTLEAVIGGIFIDQGIEATEKFIHDTILARSSELIKKQGLKDPKSALQERLQTTYSSPPQYMVVEESGPDHAKKYTVQVEIEGKKLAIGHGTSKQDAEKNAARKAIEEIGM